MFLSIEMRVTSKELEPKSKIKMFFFYSLELSKLKAMATEIGLSIAIRMTPSGLHASTTTNWSALKVVGTVTTIYLTDSSRSSSEFS